MASRTVAVEVFWAAVVWVGACQAGGAAERKAMDSTKAFELLREWGRTEGENINSIQQAANGDFLGRVASVGFQYESASQTLVVRATAKPLASSLYGYDDIMQELKRIAREEPNRVEHAEFELWKGPWDKREVSLYLRQEYKDGDVTAAVAIEKWRKLRETAYIWLRSRYVKAIDPVVQRRLKHQQSIH